MKQLFVAIASVAIGMPMAFADSGKNFTVTPATFDPSNTKMVTAAWLGGLGCVTKGHVQAFLPPNFTTSQILPYVDATCPTGDPQDTNNQGLLLAKTGPTNNNASAGAKIGGVDNLVITELGWDVRNGTHCGAGAPRFNIHLKNEPAGKIHFVGCSAMPVVSTGLYGTRRRVTAAQLAGAGFAVDPIAQGSTIDSIEIVYDEGQDTATATEAGNGLVVLDNIDINGVLVGKGPGNNGNGNGKGEGDDNNNNGHNDDH
jgi:hypothetical protein